MSTENNAPLTIQKVRELIAEKHNILLDENDPILMLVTVHRAFLDEFESMLSQQRIKTEKDMNQHVANFASEVRKSTNSLLSKAVKANIDNCLSVISAHQETMSDFLSKVKSMAILSGVLFVLSLIVTVSTLVWGA
ncbi:hypothetical protein [Maridesulfovibrio frigidus]|uniref:hypothetical protein n=1 Tax=Maridesulfovibrio frigidus TaxID=340956 RepID=UPI0004E0EF94|nr:hypothetical protein [Maridesulfovibrio frigidus]